MNPENQTDGRMRKIPSATVGFEDGKRSHKSKDAGSLS
jgi:hypothetical protein